MTLHPLELAAPERNPAAASKVPWIAAIGKTKSPSLLPPILVGDVNYEMLDVVTNRI